MVNVSSKMKCKNCNKETSNKKFCSKSCSASYNNKGVRRHGSQPVDCEYCGSKVTRTGSKFCSRSCYVRHKHEKNVKDWYSGKNISVKTIRKHLFEKHSNKCTKCGWGEINPYSKTELPPLEVEHIDGCYTNNRPENLDLLCPNCHSLTKTYKALNKGNGRPYDKYR